EPDRREVGRPLLRTRPAVEPEDGAPRLLLLAPRRGVARARRREALAHVAPRAPRRDARGTAEGRRRGRVPRLVRSGGRLEPRPRADLLDRGARDGAPRSLVVRSRAGPAREAGAAREGAGDGSGRHAETAGQVAARASARLRQDGPSEPGSPVEGAASPSTES